MNSENRDRVLITAALEALERQRIRPSSFVVLADAESCSAVVWTRIAEGSSAEWCVTRRLPLSGQTGHPAIATVLDAVAAQDGFPVLLIDLWLFCEVQDQVLSSEDLVAFCVIDVPFDDDQATARQIVKSAFDAGFVALPTLPQHDGLAVFLRSSAVTEIARTGCSFAGRVSMSSLGTNGLFANQLFQYAYLKLYALRHGLELQIPAWESAAFFNIDEKPIGTERLPELRYYAFDNEDLILWALANPVHDVDLNGYFQELPGCWTPHRALVRTMFQLSPGLGSEVASVVDDLTEGGRKQIVAVHVRRGDYVELHKRGFPWYRPVPAAWYTEWLSATLPKLGPTTLFVGTDDPDGVAEAFASFNPVFGRDLPRSDRLPAHLLDFEVLRSASYLSICNSSFSRMAAILASDEQHTFIPDFEREVFVPYEPWADRSFWARFEAGPKAEPTQGYGDEPRALRGLMIRKDRGLIQSHANGLRDRVTVLEEQIAARDGVIAKLEQDCLRLAAVRDAEMARADRLANTLRGGFSLTGRKGATLPPPAPSERSAATGLAAGATPSPLAMREDPRANSGAGSRSLGPSDFPDEQKPHVAASTVDLDPEPVLHEGDAQRVENARRDALSRFQAPPDVDSAATDVGPHTDGATSLGLLSLRRVSVVLAAGASYQLRQALERQSLAPLEVLDSEGKDLVETLDRATGTIIVLANPGLLDFSASALEFISAFLCSLNRVEVVVGTANNGVSPGARVAGFLALKKSALIEARRLLLSEGRTDDASMVRAITSHGFRSKGSIVELPEFVTCSNSAEFWDVRYSVIARPNNAGLWSTQSFFSSERLRQSIATMPLAKHQAKMPHLLVVVPWLPVGGSEILLLDVLTELKRDWRISIVTTREHVHPLTPAFQEVACDVIHAANYLDPLRMIALISGVIESRKTVVMLSSNSSLMYEFLPELKATYVGTQFVDLLHNDLAEGHFQYAVRASTALRRHIAVSGKVGDSLIANGVPPTRVRVIENGVDTTLFCPGSHDSAHRRSTLGDRQGIVHLLFVGRLSGEKRASAFLDIVQEVSRTVPVRATLIGEGPQEHELQRRIEKDKLPVEWLRKMPREQLVDLYRSADFLVLTSTIEGMPLVALEALSCGCPVAATNVGNLQKIISHGENGFLVDPERPELLVPLLLAAAASDGLSAMRSAAARTVPEAGMDRRAMLNGYSRAFAELLGAEACSQSG